MYGKTLGIIGMGRIGQSLARRAVASGGMEIIYHNRNRLNESLEKQYNARYFTFEELLRTADYISLNAPYTPETYHMIGEKQLNMMKSTAIFINTGPGGVWWTKRLWLRRLEKKIWAAALDVLNTNRILFPNWLSLTM